MDSVLLMLTGFLALLLLGQHLPPRSRGMGDRR